MRFPKGNIVLGIFILIIVIIGISMPIFFADYHAVNKQQVEDEQNEVKPVLIDRKSGKQIVIIPQKEVISEVSTEGNSDTEIDAPAPVNDGGTEPVVQDSPDNSSGNENGQSSESTSPDVSEEPSIPIDIEELPDIEVTDETIQQLIDENIENIEEEDLDTGTAIFDKLDSEYLFSFFDEGLTEEEKAIMEDYLHQMLTDEEYSTMMELFGKYIGLVQ